VLTPGLLVIGAFVCLSVGRFCVVERPGVGFVFSNFLLNLIYLDLVCYGSASVPSVSVFQLGVFCVFFLLVLSLR
jgi:hypothetical protein